MIQRHEEVQGTAFRLLFANKQAKACTLNYKFNLEVDVLEVGS
jgi:hypothetical protein